MCAKAARDSFIRLHNILIDVHEQNMYHSTDHWVQDGKLSMLLRFQI